MSRNIGERYLSHGTSWGVITSACVRAAARTTPSVMHAVAIETMDRRFPKRC